MSEQPAEPLTGLPRITRVKLTDDKDHLTQEFTIDCGTMTPSEIQVFIQDLARAYRWATDNKRL
jgi:hypothetical protein